MDTVQTDFPLHLHHGCGCLLLMCDSPAAPVFISHYGIGVKILITGMPSEVPVLLQGLISLAVWKAFVGAYWLWREFAPVGAIREQRQRTTAACVQKWWGGSQWGCHQIHDQRWQHSEAGVLSWCQLIFEAVGGSQKCTWLIAECPCPHGGYNTIPVTAHKAARYNK